MERTIRLAPETTLQSIRRAAEIDPARWPNTFDERRVALDTVKRGD